MIDFLISLLECAEVYVLTDAPAINISSIDSWSENLSI